MDENRIYTTVQGDMWDSIAYHFYGDVKYIGLLLQNNLDLLDLCFFSRNEGFHSGDSGGIRRRYTRMEKISYESAAVIRYCEI